MILERDAEPSHCEKKLKKVYLDIIFLVEETCSMTKLGMTEVRTRFFLVNRAWLLSDGSIHSEHEFSSESCYTGDESR